MRLFLFCTDVRNVVHPRAVAEIVPAVIRDLAGVDALGKMDDAYIIDFHTVAPILICYFDYSIKSNQNQGESLVYHQFRKKLHIIRLKTSISRFQTSISSLRKKIQPTADDMHLR